VNAPEFQNEIFAGIAVAVLVALPMLALMPRERTVVRRLLVITGLLLVVALLGLGAAGGTYPRVAALASACAAIGVGAVLIRLATLALFRGLLPVLAVRPARIVDDLVTTVLAFAWLLFWLHGAGLDPASLLTTSAVITAVLAFSMQDTLGNILGGIVLQLDDSVRVGDWVRIDDISGQVMDVRWRHTAVETRDRETVVIPNGWLVKNRFTVIGSRNDARTRWRRWVWFNLDPAAVPGRVCQVLEEAVGNADIPNVVDEPAPSALLMEVRDGLARYALRYWMSDPRPDDPTDSAVRVRALAALARHGIRLVSTQEERLIIKENQARHAALQATELARRRLALGEVELFAALDDDERDLLARALVKAPFVQGDTITRQGAVAHWLYLIVAGEADVWSEHDGGRSHVATLKPGSVFGEMGLMTGEPRRATITARTDVECYRLDKAAFEAILRARPDLAGDLSQVIARRQGELDSVRETAGSGRPAAPQDAIRARIRSFFGLENP
jgi:small-conductance mechanosensitive channel/CRP-like cAMP-binding protein